jgi:hypothetical protein
MAANWGQNVPTSSRHRLRHNTQLAKAFASQFVAVMIYREIDRCAAVSVVSGERPYASTFSLRLYRRHLDGLFFGA